MKPVYSIKAVESETGLSRHTIRAWEKRYRAIEPDRTDTNRRLYSRSEVERLRALQSAVEAGHSISRVAAMSTSELHSLLSSSVLQSSSASSASILVEAKAHVLTLQGPKLSRCFERGSAVLGFLDAVERVIVPLVEWVGEQWHCGALSIAQEHFATSTVRAYLDKVRSGFNADPDQASVLVATPLNQVHELGAHLVATLTAMSGVPVVFLGANVPAVELARAANQLACQTICLSIVFPKHDPSLVLELQNLRQLVGASRKIIVGGRGCESYSEVLDQIGALTIGSFQDLDRMLVEF